MSPNPRLRLQRAAGAIVEHGITVRSGQRVSTLVVYLNDVEEGGETYFPEIGLSVVPKRGNAIYFEYANSLRQVDPKSLHASSTIVKGEKWAMTKWMRERKFISANS